MESYQVIDRQRSSLPVESSILVLGGSSHVVLEQHNIQLISSFSRRTQINLAIPFSASSSSYHTTEIKMLDENLYDSPKFSFSKCSSFQGKTSRSNGIERLFTRYILIIQMNHRYLFLACFLYQYSCVPISSTHCCPRPLLDLFTD